MPIHTSTIFYRRGIPNSYTNFAFVAQTNNAIPVPISLYLKNYDFYNRNITNSTSGYKTLIWKK
jgi:hypothetical protein